MFGQGLRQVQDTLNQKAELVQREFNAVGQQLQALGVKMARAPEADRPALIQEREALYARQRDLADEANIWRDRARLAMRQPNDTATRAYLQELLDTQDAVVRPAVEYMVRLLNATPEELATMTQVQVKTIASTTQAGRFIERARTAYDLRGSDPAPRRQAASEFANRTGVAQDDQLLAELQAAAQDADPLVRETMTLAVIQMYRFRAMRAGDLDVAHEAVLQLTRLEHPAAIPVLVEVAANARTGYARTDTGMAETNNERSREAALARLAAWDTPEARAAVQAGERERERRAVQNVGRDTPRELPREVSRPRDEKPSNNWK